METEMRVGARANKPFGYKAIIIHQGGRTEILARRFALSEDKRNMVQTKAGVNFSTREEALKYAEKIIKGRVEIRAIREWLYRNRDENGRRRTEKEARLALGL